MTAIAYPYFRPRAECITATAWQLTLNGEPCAVVNGNLEHFDYSTSLKVNRVLTVDVGEVAANLGLVASELRLLCVVTVGAGGHRLQRARQVILREEINRIRESIDIDLALDGREISQLLQLTTELVLLSPGTAQGRLSPTIPGARLWRDDLRAALEPTGVRFPIEAINFRNGQWDGAGDAFWFLDWSLQDLDQDFVSSVRLYINQDTPEFVEAVQRADHVTLQMMVSSVVTQMIRAAIGIEHFPGDPGETLRSSVGSVIESWMERAFPGQTVDSVRTLAAHDPAHFELAIGGIFAAELRDE